MLNDASSRLLKRVPCFLEKKLIRKLKYALTHSPKGALNRYTRTLNVTANEKQIVKLMKKALFKYGICYEEYMLYGLYKKPFEACESYIGETERYKYYKKYNSRSEKKLLRSKAMQYEHFKEFYKREVMCADKNTQFDLFYDFVKKHGRIIVKPCDKSCGCGVEVLECADKATLVLHFTRLKKTHKAFMCEEIIEQSKDMSRFNPTSLNTVRFIQPPSDFPHFSFSPFFRMGRYGKSVDNAGSGGIFAGVDIKSGLVITVARDENGGYYPHHPDSKVQIKGFLLPEWENALLLVEALQSKVQSRLVSWDIAHTNDGWVFVEANYAGQLICQQSVYNTQQAAY